MALSNTEYGKAYEYACLIALRDHLSQLDPNTIKIIDSSAFRTAQAAYHKAAREGSAIDLSRAANAAARVILKLEPQLEYGDGNLTLVIQTDAQGIAGDVRDVVCARRSGGWEVGISCKHNHHAVKHSRLSATIDFGREWMGIPCSNQYFQTVVPIFNELRDIRDSAAAQGLPIPLWRDCPDKASRYYIPILNAFIREMESISRRDSDAPRKLIEYMLGRYDFYKVITDDKHETTRVEAVNLSGSLNKSANGHHSIVDVARLRMPTRFYHMGLSPGYDNKVDIVCDEGWALNMRIHNASSKIEPSLKFDVQLTSLPFNLHAQVEPW